MVPLLSKVCQHYILCTIVLSLCLFGCSSDGDFESDTLPEFADGLGMNPRDAGPVSVTTEGDVSITRDALGGFQAISYADAEKAPASAAEMFSRWMCLTPDDSFVLFYSEDHSWMSSPMRVERYQQFYKGVLVYQGGFAVRLQNGKVKSANGMMMKIDNLNVRPTVSEQKALETYAKYLKVPTEAVGAGHITAWFDDTLMIAEFPISKGSTQWAPRLVYGLCYHGMSKEGMCFVDAHTGRLLLTWPNYVDYTTHSD